ncbi:hypothetical protein diail_4940 [Diaporthe ilicicola]|nr:hypothetical protein diail_4940 [Diaporthe ilicicola]
MSRFRAVCTVDEQWTSALVSGVGERRPSNDLIPNPLGNDHGNAGSEEDIEEETMEIDIYSSAFGFLQLVGPAQRITGFPFHCSCWDLLNTRRETQGAAHYEPQALFDVLRSFPRHRLIEFGHDYGGIAGCDLEVDVFDTGVPLYHCRLLPGEEPRHVYIGIDSALLEIQKHNPMRIAEVRIIFEGAKLKDSLISEAHPFDPPHEDIAGSSDPFGKLPIEILQSMFSELSSPDVVALKQSSRIFQRLPLPDTFWRSRFLPGREFEHVFEAMQYLKNRNGKWKTIYHQIRKMGKHPGLVNRRRIWNLAPNLDDLLETRLSNSVCSGTMALKLVSLSLSTPGGTPAESLVSATTSLRDTALWFPDIPRPHLSFSGITTQALQLDVTGDQQRPLSMLIFGTRIGAQLNHMTHLTVLTQEEHGIMGLEVTFEHPIDGKNSLFLGSNRPCRSLGRRPPPDTLRESEMSFDIAAGEELIALDVLQGHFVLCFKVYTNLGRVVEFPPPEDGEWDMDTRAEHEGEVVSAKSDSGKVVGFFARAGSIGLQNLGLVHMEVPEKGHAQFEEGRTNAAQ